MPARVTVQQEHVAQAVATVRARGGEVAYRKGQVVGLAAVRQVSGGDADRVRAMILLLLREEGRRIPHEAVSEARGILFGQLQRTRRALTNPNVLDALIGRVATFLQPTSECAPAELTARLPTLSHLPEPARPAALGYEIVQKDIGVVDGWPAGRPDTAAKNGAGQKALATTEGSALNLMRHRQAERELPSVKAINPFDLSNIDQRRAADDTDKGHGS